MNPEALPAIAHAADEIITPEWIDTAFEWDSKTTYKSDVSNTYYHLQIHDDTMLIVHALGQVWAKDGGHGEETPLGKCHSRRQLCNLIQVLRDIA